MDNTLTPGDSQSKDDTVVKVPIADQENTNGGAITYPGELDGVHPEDLEEQWIRVKCLVCDHVYEGKGPLLKCVNCGNDDPDKLD